MPSESTPAPAGYCAYLVRLWQESPYTAWRASAQSVQTSETVRFADLERLFVFLRTQSEERLPAQTGGEERATTA